MLSLYASEYALALQFISQLFTEPDDPPQNLQGNATNATTLTLSWDPPHIEEQNGIIREYLINITEIETGETFLHSTPMTCITVTELHPFYSYESIVTAVTIGPGPYSSNFTIQMPQTGRIHKYLFSGILKMVGSRLPVVCFSVGSCACTKRKILCY